MHFSSTIYRSPPNAARPIDDPLMPLFQNFASMVQGIIGPAGEPPNAGSDGNSRGGTPAPGGMPGWPGRPEAGNSASTSTQGGDADAQVFGGTGGYTLSGRLRPRDANGPQPPMAPVDNLHGFVTIGHHHTHGPPVLLPPDRFLSQVFQHLAPVGPGNVDADRGEGLHPGGMPLAGPFAILARLLNPANAASGDAVYSQEALDRVISQLMEQHSGGNAPGPASAAAIQALPKRKVIESMLGDNGQAECSICMDNVEIGFEVTVLPCTHWFHEDCVGAWLKEHDTCPHCRQGIMPKEGRGDTARSPGQEPRHSQMPSTPGTEGSRQNPMRIPESPSGGYFLGDDRNTRREYGWPDPVRPDAGHRRNSARDNRGASDGSSGGGGITGWVRNRFGGGGG